MSSAVPGIIEALDVIEHVRFGLVSRAVRLVRRPFGLERGEEVLHRGIVPDVVGPAHATDHAVVGQEPLEGLTGVLATPIGVVQYGLGLASPPDGQHECIGDQCVVMVACMDQPTTRREKRSTTAVT